MKSTIHLLLLIFSCFLLTACQTKQQKAPSFEKKLATVAALAQHSQEFNQPTVSQVVEGIYVAVGFGLANSILIEGKNSNIIVDCLESNEAAARVKAKFDSISPKPVKAIIYTHNHTDHIFGSEIMAGNEQPDVYAHELTNYYIDRLVSVVLDGIERRSYRMFGTHLRGNGHVNCGIGPFLDAHDATTRSLLRPTITFKDSLMTVIEGIDIQLFHMPGETNDQIAVWLPKQKALLSGDNIYKSFPNLYTIRGTPYRDVREWANSLDKLRELQAEVLIPSHTQPIQGAKKIEQLLTDYADGIRFVHDQTIRYMNKGLTPDEIVELVQLPEHLQKNPHLQEFYGRVDWSVRSIFTGYFGWFDGNATTLLPSSPTQKAKNMAALVGGTTQLLDKAEEAFQEKNFQWALELSDHLLKLDANHQTAKDLRHECLLALGQQQANPNARNYYLSQALEVKGYDIVHKTPRPPSIVHKIPLASIFNSMGVRLASERCLDYNKKAVFRFTDTGEAWTVHIRNGVAEVKATAINEPDISVETTAIIWKEIAAKLRSPVAAIAKGEVKIEGGLGNFKEFMEMFEI